MESETTFRSWRRRLRLTQAQAAKALGRSPRQVGDYDKGAVPLPRVVELAMARLEEHPKLLNGFLNGESG